MDSILKITILRTLHEREKDYFSRYNMTTTFTCKTFQNIQCIHCNPAGLQHKAVKNAS